MGDLGHIGLREGVSLEPTSEVMTGRVTQRWPLLGSYITVLYCGMRVYIPWLLPHYYLRHCALVH